MKTIVPLLYVVLYLLIAPAKSPAEDLSFNLSAEGGPHLANNSDMEPFGRITARARYRKSFNDNFVNMKARFSPEIYGRDVSRSAFKFSAELLAGRQHIDYFWQIQLLTSQFQYNSGGSLNSKFSTFILGSSYTRFFSSTWQGRITLDYLYRDSGNYPHIKLDALRFLAGPVWIVSASSQASGEIHLESYHVSQQDIPDAARRNFGWRGGFRFSLQHRATSIFNTSLQGILQTSQKEDEPSPEIRIDALWGRYLSSRWSVFTMINYQWRKENGGSTPAYLQYTPVEIENWIYAKVVYDLDNGSELFLRCGYFRDDLQDSSQNFSGWQASVGIDVKF
jgi:hypothetical protein